MPDVTRQIAVKATANAASPTVYDIGSVADKVDYTPDSMGIEDLVEGEPTTVENALNYLNANRGGGSKVTVVEFDSFSSLPQTKSNVDGISTGSVLIESTLSNPSAQTGDWTVTTTEKTVTITGTINGSTTAKLVFADDNTASAGTGDSVEHRRILKADYDALSAEDKAKNIVYFIEDWDNPQVVEDFGRNEYKDITDDFNSGLFSDRINTYRPGNFILKTYNNVTYAAVLADYNTFRGTRGTQNSNAMINQDHWVAIVLGFADGVMNSTNTTANAFTGSAMNTWLKGDCTTIVRAVFGDDHLIKHSCLLTTGTYNSTAAPSYGFSWAWEADHYTMLMSEAQIYGVNAMSFSYYDTGEAFRQFKIFQNEPYMYVLGRDYGQSNNNFNTKHCWVRNIGAYSPGTNFCFASSDGGAGHDGASYSRGRYPIIMLK